MTSMYFPVKRYSPPGMAMAPVIPYCHQAPIGYHHLHSARFLSDRSLTPIRVKARCTRADTPSHTKGGWHRAEARLSGRLPIRRHELAKTGTAGREWNGMLAEKVGLHFWQV